MLAATRTLRPSIALFAAVAAGMGCADESVRMRIGLLARDPDVRVEQPGALTPILDEGWGLHGQGWLPRAVESDRGPYVWARHERTELTLPATRPRDRRIAFEARFVGAATAQLEVELNGTALGTVEIERRPRGFAFDAGSSLWREGDNRLALSLLTDSDPGKRKFGLSQVEYGEARELVVDRSAQQLRLESECAALYRVGARPGDALHVAGRAQGAGLLTLELESLDPTTGATLRLPATQVRENLRNAATVAEIVVPDVPQPIVGLWIRWDGEPASRFELDELELIFAARVARPPIVFLSIDTLAAKHMSLYGYPRRTTPELERFAREAVNFEHCKANAPWTLPSYASQMTGFYPGSLAPASTSNLKHARPSARLPFEIAEHHWTLPEMLRSAGYATAAFVDNGYVSGRGFRQGFDHFDSSAARISTVDPLGGMRRCFPLTLDWIANASVSAPWFAFVQILDCHGPYLPQKPWKGSYAGDALDREPRQSVPVSLANRSLFGAVMASHAETLGLEDAKPSHLPVGPLVRAYDEKVLEVDAVVGEFLQSLRERPDYDELLIVISADHGESMLEHGSFFNHSVVHEPTLHVPLLVRFPGGEFGGTRIPHPVQLVDLFPTLADYLDLSDQTRQVHGRSWLPLLEGDSQPDPAGILASTDSLSQRSLELDGWKLVVFDPKPHELELALTHPRIVAEFGEDLARFYGSTTWPPDDWYKGGALERFLEEQPSIVAQTIEALGKHGPIVQLFHLEEDPQELLDLAAEHPGRVQRLLEQLAQQEERIRATRERYPTTGSTTDDLGDDPARREELQRLGYAEFESSSDS